MRKLQKVVANLAFTLISLKSTSGETTFTPFLPPSYPLAVRNPYFSVWLPGHLAADLPISAPQFWCGNDLGWSVIARVDGTAYNLFGSTEFPASAATVDSGSFSATHSVFSLTAGKAQFTLDFFSPVSFTDYTRQSFPFSYLTISVSGADGISPSVQVYSDIDETWTGQNASTQSSFLQSGQTSIFQLAASNQLPYHESKNEQALWGEAIWASRVDKASNVTTRSGPAADIRDSFANEGTLTGSSPSWEQGYVAAIAHDLGTVSHSSNVTYAIGFVREDAINYLDTASYTHYYRATYPNTTDAVIAFLDDYDAAYSEAASLEAEIETKGTALGGQNYTDILSLSVLQTLGGIEVTIPSSALNTDEVYLFIKEISSDGNLNTIDIIVELIPFFYIFNIEYLRLLLNPVLDYLATGAWPLTYCIHDLGSNYPNATGHNNGVAESMPVEESGNLLIMATIIEKLSGKSNWISKYEPIFTQYADYLIDNGLYPSYQLSTTDGLGPFTNMTQLGVKAAVALAAWGDITGNATYAQTGADFANTIYNDDVGVRGSNSTGETYFTLTYNNSAYFLLFNLFPARLLGLDVFPEAAYKGQSDFYASIIGEYGITIEGLVDWGKTDWQLWSAAVAEQSTRQQIIDAVHAYVSNNLNTAPFADRYWVQGDSKGEAAANFRARPVLGAHFAIWALDQS